MEMPDSVYYRVQVKDLVRKLALEELHSKQLKDLTDHGITVKDATVLIRITDKIVLESN